MGIFVLVALAVALVLLPRMWTRPPVAALRDLDDDTEPPEEPCLKPFVRVSPRHVTEAQAAIAEFHSHFKSTFGSSREPAKGVRRLFAARARALEALHEVRMRLPNDLALEKRLVRATEAVDRDMLERIEDARQRRGALLVHPGPVDDAFYGAWYRAPNDYIV